MSTGFGGFGGFGSNNQQQQQNTGFGAFGSNNNTAGGFGSNTNTGFGANTNTGGGLFGSSNTNTNTGFGGFGATTQNNSSPFGGAKPAPAFGASATTSGGLFGSGTSTSGGFGGFGATANNTASTGFGSGNTGGGLFGQQNKPAFGASNTGTSLFGGGNTSTGFGSNNNTTTNTSQPFTTGGFTGAAGTATQNNGTANVPFQAFSEKDGNAGGTSQYQSICFQDNYKNFSPEELRVVDYAQGRRYGNANGQAGAFGTSTGFGGFGQNQTQPQQSTGFGSNTNTGGGLFGQQQNTTNPFGATTNTNTGFGGNTSTGGGLFGAKPATGGLFGSTPATSGQQSGGLFGTTNTTGGFGSANTTGGFGSNTNNNTGGGLFGNQNNQAKPAFGGFGTANNTTTAGGFGGNTGGFGNNTNTSTGGGLFGTQTATAGSFGNNQTQPQTGGLFGGGGGFGANQQTQNQAQPSGGLFGGGFGANASNQQKPGGLFGSTGTTTGGGLFGNQTNTQQNTSGGLFGSQTQNQSGGLFGNKPATTGGGLFGNSQNTNTGGGLFGNQPQQQQNTGGSLFGNANNQQNTSGGLFGAKPAQPTTGGSLFGNLNQNNNASQPLGGSLFGNSQQNQQPQLGGSMFGGSQQQPQQQQQTSFMASINDNPYGNDQLFQGLGTPSQSVGPLATPLSTSQKMKKNAILPQYKINPAASTRLITPQKRPTGYGFSYSTYGTPGSAFSNASPNFANSLLSPSNSFGRSLGKSFSQSNLRTSYNADSILAPGALNPTPNRGYMSGSLKRLNIDRSLNTRRISLFGDDDKEKKQVTFGETHKDNVFTNGTNATNGDNSNHDSMSGALVRTEADSPATVTEDAGHTPAAPRTNGVSGGRSRPEMEQVGGKELSVVPEDSTMAPPKRKPLSGLEEKNRKLRTAMADQEPGNYWMKPTLDELRAKSPQQLKHVENFVVGRDGIGRIEFDPVDLSDTPLELILGKIIKLNVRQATVYGDDTPVEKPPPGKGMNQPSKIYLENSWPRTQGGKLPVQEQKGPRFQKHITRLKRVPGTEYVSYDQESGTWGFRVPHYTTYELVYDDDEEDETSMLSAPPTNLESPTPAGRPGHTPAATAARTQTYSSPALSSPDDTFDFKKGKRVRIPQTPGAFDDEYMDDGEEEDEGAEDQEMTEQSQQSFLGERSVGSRLNGYEEDLDEEDLDAEGDESGMVEEQDMVGAFPEPDRTTEQETATNQAIQPKSILKSSMRPRNTPSKGAFTMGDDWAEQLQRTISPKKQDRQALRSNQVTAVQEQPQQQTAPKPLANNAFTTNMTSIDLMKSLFGQSTNKSTQNANKQSGSAKGFQYPYAKRQKVNADFENMNENDKGFHQSNKPRWSIDGTLTYAIPGNAPTMHDGSMVQVMDAVTAQPKDIRFVKFVYTTDPSKTITYQHEITAIKPGQDLIPEIRPTEDFEFAEFVPYCNANTDASRQEKASWELLAILFDPVAGSAEHVPHIRTRNLVKFWKKLVRDDVEKAASQAANAEERAIAYLSGGNVPEAVAALIDGKDTRLAAAIAQIASGNAAAQTDIRAQLAEWRRLSVISEVQEPIRALLQLLAGGDKPNECEGKTGAGPENFAKTFKISTRFGLDWKRAFGLRLFCWMTDGMTLDDAISQFHDEINDKREEVKPTSPFNRDASEDILFCLLRLFHAVEKGANVDATEIFAPENVTDSPLLARLVWQLLHLLIARGVFALSDTAIADAADSLTHTYASSLLSEQTWPQAIWVFTHLTDAGARGSAIKTILDRYASTITDIDASPTGEASQSQRSMSYLTSTLAIPSAWIHSSLALYARSVLEDPIKEVHHLLQAGERQAAHEVLCRTVAPRAIIEMEYDLLREVLGGFEGPNEMDIDGGASKPEGWDINGGMYFDYIHLLDLQSHRGSTSDTAADDKARLLRRLSRSLEAAGTSLKSKDVYERAAISEMAKTVAQQLVKDGSEKGRVLKLPLAENECLRLGMGLVVPYYQGVMAGGR